MNDVHRPKLVTDRRQLRQELLAARRAGKRIGLVPTMGALHEGHLSLVDASRGECDQTWVTIFVNPAQFAPHEDLEAYPRNLERDLALVASRGADLVFAPSPREIYPDGFDTYVEPGGVAKTLEGAIRPTHFRGVATVVLKLFNLVPADVAFFGRKDYQQTLVVKRMARDFDLPIEVRVCPIVRDWDGLALSSRNAYLSPQEREQARAIPASLELARRLVSEGTRDAAALREAMVKHLQAAGLEVQYVELVRDETLDPVARIEGPTVVLVAARAGATRLIDNELLDV